MHNQMANQFEANPNYCEISYGNGICKYSYKGSNPFKDTMKSGLAFSFTVLIILGGCCYINRRFRSKSKNVQAESHNDEQVITPLPEAKTLNDVCSEKSEDSKSSELSGELLDKGDSLVIYSSPKEGKSTLAMGDRKSVV